MSPSEFANYYHPYLFLAIFTGGWLLLSVIAWFTTIRYEKEKREKKDKEDL